MNKKLLYGLLGIPAIIILVVIFQYRDKTPESQNGVFLSDNTSGLSEIQPTTAIELKNGDTYNLTAGFVKKQIGNRTYRMLAYNGSIPGPLIKVAQGAEITINFKNNTDVDTTIHSHGIRLENKFDGAVPMNQQAVKPGETFVYKIKFPDAGMYWYHPHVREDYAQELGLYGNYLVVPNESNYWNKVNREVPLFLDDILIEGGQIRLNKQEADRTLMGRFGNVMLVNGEPDYQFNVKKDEVVRFYLTNAANTRTFNVTIPGVKMKLVGGDGGAYEREEWQEAVVLGPSERGVIEALFPESGIYSLENRTPERTYTLGTITVSEEAATPSYANSFNTLRTNQTVVASIDPLRSLFDKPIDKQLNLRIEMMSGMGSAGSSDHMSANGHMMGGGMMMGKPSSDGIEWDDASPMMNAMSTKDMTKWNIVDKATNKQNMEIGWKFKVGDKVKIRITNDATSAHPMQHPIHFHGQRFLVLDRNGIKQTNLVWKDTVMVPAGQYVDILLDITNPGEWMAHCHIAEHLEAGMAMQFTVEN